MGVRIARSASIVALASVILLSAGCGRSRRVVKNDGDGDGAASSVNATNANASGTNTTGAATTNASIPTKPFQPDQIDLPPRTGQPGGGNSDLYGPTGGESTLRADSAPPSAPLRARKVDTCYKLSNPRIESARAIGKKGPPRPGTGQVLAIDYEMAAERAVGGNLSIVIRTSGGKDHVVSLNQLRDRAGTIALEVAYRGPWTGALPKDAEFYLTRWEPRYGADLRRAFKVSNSILMGEARFPITQARDWTQAELAAFAVPPVEPPHAGANAGVGENTKLVGSPGAAKLRYVDPTRPLIGVDVSTGFWPVKDGREDCLNGLTPIFDRAYPNQGMTRFLAKPGYAVGAVAVKTKTFVNSVRITFMKLNANGTLDPKDSYTTPWFGPEVSGAKETQLGGDGRKVIGVHLDQGGVLNALGLVLEATR